MIEIVCASISAIAAVVVAFVGVRGEKRSKRAERRAAEREQIYQLQMEMQTANTELTKAIAIAIKRGYPNGEIEAAFATVGKTEEKYNKYLQGLAAKKIAKI